MESGHGLVTTVIFSSIFLILTSLLQRTSKKYAFLPYTVVLLVLGIVTQQVVHFFNLNIHLSLSPDIIYFVLLPLLLFESAFHINFHQFKLQFKTITFFATVGLLLSIATITFLLSILAGYPVEMALLFGAIISATDPIAVIALFKSLGAPKRLGLVADGESMFNDATGVIAFRVISGFVVGGTAFQNQAVFGSVGNFIYVFLGSIIFGIIAGYFVSKIIEPIKNDPIVEATFTLALALGSFAASEYFFHLSGVIACVVAGITLGNLGKTKISAEAAGFIDELWEYLGFVSLSLVFFFATFNLDFEIFTRNPTLILIAIFSVLVGRAVSVYVSAFFTNRDSFFRDEPNIPMKWQHILTWGGLRGVIPLVLVYSLPEEFAYRDDMLSFTLGALLFTLFVNGLTIRTLLMKLGLHLPQKEEEIMKEEMTIFELEEAKESLDQLEEHEFDQELIETVKKELREQEILHKKRLNELASPEDFEKSLRLQVLEIERKTLQKVYQDGYVTENAYYDFEGELDIQQDAIEYPEVSKGRAILEGGKITARLSFRRRLRQLRETSANFPFLKNMLKATRENFIKDRLGLLQARILTSEAVIEYFDKLEKFMAENNVAVTVMKTLEKEHSELIKVNKDDLEKLAAQYPQLLSEYQRSLAYLHIHAKA